MAAGPIPRDRSGARSLDVGLPPDVDHQRCALRVLEAVWQDSKALLQCLGPWFQNSNCLNLSQGIKCMRLHPACSTSQEAAIGAPGERATVQKLLLAPRDGGPKVTMR